MNVKKLAIGTVQFGLDYGISNTGGKMSFPEAMRVLSEAEAFGIRLLDTAATYGDSEEVVGRYLKDGINPFDIVTKISIGQREDNDKKNITAAIDGILQRSMERLGQNRIYGLLAHSPDDLTGTQGEILWAWMENQKCCGRVEKTGASVYYPREAIEIMNKYPVDILQIPLSVFDQRMNVSGVIKEAKSRGIEIHCRSVFLQGLYFMDPRITGNYFEPVRPFLEEFSGAVSRSGYTMQEVLLGFALSVEGVDNVIVGVENSRQLVQIIEAAGVTVEGFDWARWQLDDVRFVVPSNWVLKKHNKRRDS